MKLKSCSINNCIRNSRHLQLLTECVQGLAKEICVVPFSSQDDISKEKIKSLKDSKRYVQNTFYFLILFSLLLTVPVGLLLYKKRTFYSTTDTFSGTVIIKRAFNENEYYIFIPQKVRVSKDDFFLINEGDKVAKKKGQRTITVIKTEEKSDREDFLDLL